MIKRILSEKIEQVLKRGKSILLLGPRQTGKTTLVERFAADLTITFLSQRTRLEYERNPDLLIQEVAALNKKKKMPLVVVDEIQKVPQLMDPIQLLIDKKKALFIITGSSARKLKTYADINLLPGRVISLHMDALALPEFEPDSLDDQLYFGSLPEISLIENRDDRDELLQSYVETYMEEEIRKEAHLRNLPEFYRFLELASLEAGKIVTYTQIATEIGISHTTVKSYYQILVDTLLAERLEPLTKSETRKKLIKSPKFLFFDLGVRRLSAREGYPVSPVRRGELFEQWVGLELLKLNRLFSHKAKVQFWQDPEVAEVDWILTYANGSYVPIEVKYSANPNRKEIRHLQKFLDEYHCPKGGFVICNCRNPMKLTQNVTALPWKQIASVF